MTDNLPAVSGGISPIQAMKEMKESGVSVEDMKGILEVQMKWEANEARKAYSTAMAKFKANPPDIRKSKHVSYEAKGHTTSYWHADLADINQRINDELFKHGLHATWSHSCLDNKIGVTCKITHEQGHSEETTLYGPPDTSGGKNNIQAIGSTTEYLRRYTILALTGLVAKGMDNDGAGDPNLIDKGQISTIESLLKKNNIDKSSFLTYMSCEAVDNIPKAFFKKAMIALDMPKGQKNDN